MADLAGILVSAETWTDTITGTDGREWSVTFRRPTAGDQADVARESIILEAGDGDEGPTVRQDVGRAQFLLLARCVVSWDFDLEVTPAIFAAMEPGVIAQLRAHVERGRPRTDAERGLPPQTTSERHSGGKR